MSSIRLVAYDDSDEEDEGKVSDKELDIERRKTTIEEDEEEDSSDEESSSSEGEDSEDDEEEGGIKDLIVDGKIICRMCTKVEAKYRCPRCGFRSCSLICCQAHKQGEVPFDLLTTATQTKDRKRKRLELRKYQRCSGKRRRFHIDPSTTPGYVSTNDLSGETLQSDLRFLGDLERAVSSKDDPTSATSRGTSWKQDVRLRRLQNKAKMRQTRLLFMPLQSTSRRNNTTHYDQKKKLIVWKVEWVFPSLSPSSSSSGSTSSSPFTIVDSKVPETTPIFAAVARHLQNLDVKQKLHPYLHNSFSRSSTTTLKEVIEEVGEQEQGQREVKVKSEPESWLFFLLAERTPANDRRWFQLEPSHTLQAALENKIVIENPRIHVVLPSDAERYPLASPEVHQQTLASVDEQQRRRGRGRGGFRGDSGGFRGRGRGRGKGGRGRGGFATRGEFNQTSEEEGEVEVEVEGESGGEDYGEKEGEEAPYEATSSESIPLPLMDVHKMVTNIAGALQADLMTTI